MWFELVDALWLAGHTDGPGPLHALGAPSVTEPERPEPPERPAPSGRPEPPEPTAADGGSAPSAESAPPMESAPPEEGYRSGPVAATVRSEPAPVGSRRGRPTRGARPVLRRAREIARALRPLKQFLPSAHRQVLDEELTAVRSAELNRWLPELRPAAELHWDVVVVIDDHPSFAVFREIVREFVALLRRQGAFRDVMVRTLNTDANRADDMVLRGTGGALPASPSTLLAGADRRLVIVLTDGAAKAWHAGTVLPVLHRWARRLPVVVVNPLEQRQWFRSGVRPVRMRMRSPRPGAPNGRLAWAAREPSPLDEWDTGDRSLVPLPVLELEPQWISAWVRLVTAGGWVNLPGVLVGSVQPADPDDDGDADEPRERPAAPAKKRVLEFASWATPTALTLATHLAAAPLNLPVMKILQRELLPDSDASHLSEVLNSGLLYPVDEPAADPARIDRVAYEFGQGIREELLAVGRRTQTKRVVRMVGSVVPGMSDLHHVLDDPDTGPPREVTADTEPFVRFEQAVLQALSGRYLNRSRYLRATLAPASQLEPQPVTMGRPVVVERPDPPTSERAPGVSTTHEVEEPVATPVPAPERVRAGSPAVWGNVPPRNPNFTGRGELLDQLFERVRIGTTAVLPHALHGMGGVGKSLLANEYVYRHQNDYDVVWWISAELTAQIQNALVELAQRMGLPVGREANTAVPAVLEALRTGVPYRNWLLIFDNAESPEAVRRFFPNGGPGSIIVTSRNPLWANAAEPLLVDVFTREESKALLRRRGPDLADADADRLATALGDLPLALEQAAAWRAETGMPADEYLRLFDEKRLELLQVAVPMDYQMPVATAWNVSLDQLARSSPGALRLLQVCAFFAPEPIARTLLGQVRSPEVHPELLATLSDAMNLSRSIREINRYALARIDHRTNSIQMHRLVQAVLVDRMTEAERTSMRNSAHLLLAARDPANPVAPENWSMYAELYPHLMASEAFLSTDSWVHQLVDNAAYYLYWWGDHGAALDLSRLAFDFRSERVGSEAPTTLKIGRWLGFMLFVTGRFAEAAEFNARMLRAHESISNQDTEELLAAVGAVAADRRVAGDFQGALEIDEALYQRHVRALGDDDPATLNAGHNLAVSIRLVGDLRGALDRDEKTAQRRGRMFGEDHPNTLESEQNRIIDQRELGDYVTARAGQQRIVDRLRQLLSPGHPQTLRAMRSLSVAMRQEGDHQAARDMSEVVRTGFVTRYGENHPDTLVAMLNLSIDLRQTGQLDAAVELSDKVHAGYTRLLGADHPHTVVANVNGAVPRRLRGDAAGARAIDEAGRDALMTRLGQDHPSVLACSVNLANDLYAQGEFQAAFDLDSDTAERLRRVLGDDHPTTLACLGNLASDLQALGRESEAAELRASTVAAFEHTLGAKHPAVAIAADLQQRANCDLNVMPL